MKIFKKFKKRIKKIKKKAKVIKPVVTIVLAVLMTVFKLMADSDNTAGMSISDNDVKVGRFENPTNYNLSIDIDNVQIINIKNSEDSDNSNNINNSDFFNSERYIDENNASMIIIIK